jgi:hypothetical protein
MRKILTHTGNSQVVSHKISNGVLKFYCAGATDRRSCWIRRIVILTSCFAWASAGETPGFWTRINYGVVATKTKTVCLIDDYATHTIEIKLPTATPTNITTENFSGPCDPLCHRLRSIANLTRLLTASMQNSVTQSLERLYSLVPDTDEPTSNQRRKTRALFSLGGRISSYLFGTATETQVQQVRKEIADQKLMSETALADGTRTRQAVAEFTQLTNRRLSNMHVVLNDQQINIAAIAQRLRVMSDNTFAWTNALLYAIVELSRYITIHDDIMALETGVEALVSAQLTPALISVREIQTILNNLKQTLSANGQKLCAKTPQDVFESKSFQFLRHKNSLYIRLLFPYTRYPAMAIYRTTVLPLPVTGNQQLVTELKNFPKWIIQDSDEHFLGHLIAPVQTPVVDLSNVIVHSKQRTSCLAAIFHDDTDAIRRTCEFSTRQTTIDPIYLKLNASTYIVHNLTNPQLLCAGANIRPIANKTCIPCIVTVGCSCVLKAEEARIGASQDCRRNPENTTILFSSYNAAVLKEFYDLTNQSLQGDHLVPFEKLTEPQPLEIPFFSSNVTQLLAADDSLAYSLNKIARSLQNASSVLHSPTEAVLFQYMRQMAQTAASFPNFNSIETWLILTPLPCIAILVTATIFLHRRIQVLTLALTIAAPRAQAFDLRTPMPTPAISTTPSPLIQWIETFRQHDFILISLMIVVLISLIFISIALHHAVTRHSFLYIDLSTARHVVQLKFFRLPDSTRCYAVTLPRQNTQLAFRSYFFFGVVAFTSQPWTLSHSLTKKQIKLPRILLIAPWKLRILHQIFASDQYTANPLVIHTHEYAYTRPTDALRTIDESCPPYHEEQYV